MLDRNKRPDNKKLEHAMLVHAKTLCIQMPGNSCWNHKRDYDGLVKLVDRWNDSLEDNKLDKEYKEELKRFMIITSEQYDDDWSEVSDLRIISHRYMNEFGDYPSDEYEMADMWMIKRIRELTDS